MNININLNVKRTLFYNFAYIMGTSMFSDCSEMSNNGSTLFYSPVPHVHTMQFLW